MSGSLDVVIPAYNESGYIGRTVTALCRLPGIINNILVVDDGSTDDTTREAASAGARVVRLERNRGKSAAVLHGAHFVNTPYLAMIDADLGDTASELVRLFEPVCSGSAAMTIARFPRAKTPGGLGLAKKLAAWSIRRSTGQVMNEPLSGQRVLRRELLQLLRYPPRGFGFEVALTIDLLKKGHRVLEVPTIMAHRERGRDAASFLHRGRQCAAILRELWIRREFLV